MAMIVERSMSDGWLTNTYLVAAGPNSDAFLVDAGGPIEPLFDEGRRARPQRHPRPAHPPPRRPRLRRCGDPLERYPDAQGARAPRRARSRAPTGDLNPGDELDDRRADRQGAAHPRPHGGHAQPARRRQGAVHRRHALQGLRRRRPRARLAPRFEDIKHSIMEVILTLPPETVIRPGHTDPTHGRRRARAQPVRAHLARRWTPRAASSARRSATPPRWCSGAPTTTAATRPGCAGPTAATTSCPGSKVER